MQSNYTIYYNIQQYLAKWFTLYSVNHKNNKPYKAKTNYRAILRQATYVYLRHWKTPEATLTME